MGFLDWVKDIFDGEDPKPAAKPTQTVQAEKPAPFPRPAQPFSPKAAPEWAKPASEKQTYGPWAPPPTPSDGVRELLNKQNWTTPKPGKQAEMPETSFEQDSVQQLKSHDYRVSNEEWSRIQSLYDTPQAASFGYSPPEIGTVSVDQNMPLMELGEVESAALTWDAYEAMSKDQRAAVDFNSLLVTAREKDLGTQTVVGKAQRDEYDEKVRKMFGAVGGSETYAPATLGLLSDLNMDLVGQDIDEYLSLERAFDTSELKGFKFSDEQVKTLTTKLNAPSVTYADVRTPENMRAVDTAGVQKAQELIKSAFANPDAIAINLDTLMGNVTPGLPPLGWGTASTAWERPEDAALNQWFKDAAFALGTEDTSSLPEGTDPTTFLLGELAKQPGYSDATQQQFLDYLTNISSMAGQYGTSEDQTMAALIQKRLGG